MRESLTVLAMLLIVVLTTALVGPYFVDWNAHRGEIEKRLSGLLGANVAVAGPIDVKLLPRPIFRMQDVSVSGRTPGQGAASAARVDMELSLTALLRGEILFVDADITAPRVTLPLGPDRSVMLPRLGDATADRISLVHLALHDGTVVFTGTDGRPAFSAAGIAGDAEADSLAGPFKFTGQVDTPRGPLALRVATGAIDSGRMRLKVGVDASEGVPRTDIDGIAVATAAGGGSSLSFEGSLATGGAHPLPRSTNVIPWSLTASIRAEPGHVEVRQAELRAGADGRALIAALTGDVALGKAAAARITVHARQVDVGRLAVPQDPQKVADPKTPVAIGDSFATLIALAGDADLTTALPLPVALDYGIDTIVLGDLTLGSLNGHATLTAGKPMTGTLALEAADGSRMTFDGSYEPGPAAVFKGRLQASSAHLQRFADSLSADLPDVATAIRRALPVDNLLLSGVVDLSGIGIAAHDVSLTLDRSRFAGTITLTRAVGSDHARLFADLTSDALDLDALPDWRDTAQAASDLDVSLTLVAHATRLASTDTGSVNAGRAALELKKEGRVITVDRLSLANIGGASVDFRGSSDGRTAHAEGHLDAKRLHDLVALIDRIAPGLLSDELLARADALSPALLSLAADASFSPDGIPLPTLVSLEGSAAATTVTLHLRPNERPRATSGTPALALDLMLDAPDSGVLLRQLGLPTTPSNAVGHGRVELTGRRDVQGVLAGALKASLGDTVINVDGHGTPGHSSGRISIKSPNIAPLARAVLIANPEPGSVWPAEATAAVTTSDRRIAAENLAGKLLGTSFGGTLAYVAPQGSSGAVATDAPAGPTPPSLTGSLTIDRLPLTIVTAVVIGPLPPAKPGILWPDAPLAPTLLSLPRSEIALAASSLPMISGLVASNAKATLRLNGGALTITDLSATLGQGSIAGTTTLRRDGAAASLSGHVEWAGLPVAGPSFGGISRGSLDVAGSGNSVSAVMGSLAGSGTIGLADARLPRFDPTAIGRVIASSDNAPATIDGSAIATELGQDLDHGALALGAVTLPVTVAAGVMRSDSIRVQGPVLDTEASGTLDLRTLLLSLKATASLRSPPKDWTGAPPQVGVVWKGPFLSPARVVDAAALVNGIAARAIARDQARIEAFQEDVRERAFFARRLKAIETEQQAARDQAKADAEADRQRLQTMIQGNAAPSPTGDSTGGRPTPASSSRRPGPAAKPLDPAKPLDLH